MEFKKPLSNPIKPTVPPRLISRLKEKKRLLEAGDRNHRKIKTALIIDGGAMLGVYAAGVVAALKELGFEDVFDLVVAVSAGTLSVSYFLSGEAELAPELFYTYLASRKFINILKIHPPAIVGFGYFNEVLSQILPIKVQRIKKSRAKVLYGVTDPDTGKAVYLDIKKDAIDILAAIHASSAVPLMHTSVIPINNKKYLDGMIACGVPIAPALEYGCTDILIIENMPVGKRGFFGIPVPKLLFKLYKFHPTPAAKKAIFNRKQRYLETLQEISKAKEQGIDIGFIAPDTLKIKPFSINSKLLKQTAEEAKEKTLRLFT